MKLIGGILIVLVVFGGIYFYSSSQTKTTEPTAMQKEGQATAEGSSQENEGDMHKMEAQDPISLDEIAKHSTAEDCWFAIEGKVYDVTEYIAGAKHPGGEAILEGCGTDATVLFNTRPMGSGTPHSEKARSLRENFIIGDLAQ